MTSTTTSVRDRALLSVIVCTTLFATLCIAKDVDRSDVKKRSSSSSSMTSFLKRDLSDDQYNTYAIAHATVGSVATMIIFPTGVAGARWLRLLSAKWWILHAVLQGFFGLGCIVAAFALGVILTDPSSPANFSQGHHRTGLVLFILVVLQVIVGVALKGMPKKAKTTRVAIKGHPIQNLFHVLSGLTILGLGFWQTWSGFSLLNQEANGLTVPLGVYVVWGVLVGITAWTYLMSLLWVPRQLRIERERRGDTMVDNKNSTSSGIIGRRLDSVDQERGGVPAPMHNGPGPLKSSRVPERGVNATNEPTYVDDSSTFAPSNNHSFDASRRTSTAPLVEGR